MELIYILTYNCNFRCTYCDIDKRKEDMSELVLEQSMKFLEGLDIPLEKVKFFGGEPLLQKKQIYYVVNNFPKQQKPSFYVTSNSTLIDDDFINFSDSVGLKLTFSIDGDASTTAKNRKVLGGLDLSSQIIANTQKYHKYIRVNQVVTSANSHLFFENFKYIYDLGVKQFNFLPEYYREWSKQGLKNLQKGFQQILNFYRAGNDMYLVNGENYSETSFFNLGIVIDTDGSIYGTNLILAGIFEKYKPELKIGDVYNGIYEDIEDILFQKNYITKVQKFLQKEHSQNVIKSVRYVDSILSNFVCNFDNT